MRGSKINKGSPQSFLRLGPIRKTGLAQLKGSHVTPGERPEDEVLDECCRKQVQEAFRSELGGCGGGGLAGEDSHCGEGGEKTLWKRQGWIWFLKIEDEWRKR